MSTFALPGLDLRTTPDDQNHPKDPPEPSPDTPREPSVISVPFALYPRTPSGILRTPQGPPGQQDTQGTTKGSPRASHDP